MAMHGIHRSAIQKQPNCEKSEGQKRCEIKGGDQEMAVMIVQWQKSRHTVVCRRAAQEAGAPNL